jgi:3-hydroxyacyl-CoA dehydrogenase
VLTGSVSVTREPGLGDWDQAVAAARLFADGKLHGAAPAPYRAIDLVAAARGRTRDEGFAAEDEALADLLLSEELRAGLYAFDLTQKRARHAAGAPDPSLARPVTKIGVVGAGLMAAQIALLFARRLEVPVVLTDLDQARLDAGLGHVRAEVAGLRERGRIGADAAARLTALVTGSLTKDAFADADFVIEAVFEEMAIKQRVLAEVEAVVRPDCVLATNTSSLSVTEMASGLAHPSRVVGFHFFNPVAMMPLVEVVLGAATDALSTDEGTAATALAVGTKLKKNCVLVKDAPAFVVNRLLTRFLGEILACVDEGTPLEVAEHAPDPLGLPMSPFFLLQLVGPAVALHVGETLAAAYPDRFAPSPKLRALVAAGKTAVYRPDLTIDESVAALLARGDDPPRPPREGIAGGDRPSTTGEVRERALEALADEIRLMLDEGVVAGPEDIDLCMILGAGWPFHLGGITPYLDRTGIAEKVTGTRFHL